MKKLLLLIEYGIGFIIAFAGFLNYAYADTITVSGSTGISNANTSGVITHVQGRSDTVCGDQTSGFDINGSSTYRHYHSNSNWGEDVSIPYNFGDVFSPYNLDSCVGTGGYTDGVIDLSVTVTSAEPTTCDAPINVSSTVPISSSTINNTSNLWHVTTDNLLEGCNYSIIINYRVSNQTYGYTDSINENITPDTTNTNSFYIPQKSVNLWNIYNGTTTEISYYISVINRSDTTNGLILGSQLGNFFLGYSSTASNVPATNNIGTPYDPNEDAGGGQNLGNGGTVTLWGNTSTPDLNSMCLSSSTASLWDMSTWGCGIQNFLYTIGGWGTGGARGAVGLLTTAMQSTFIFAPITNINADIQTAMNNATSSDSTVTLNASGSPSVFGGYTYVIFSSSTTSWIPQHTGFDIMAFISNIIYLLTGLIIFGSTIAIIKAMHDSNNGQ